MPGVISCVPSRHQVFRLFKHITVHPLQRQAQADQARVCVPIILEPSFGIYQSPLTAAFCSSCCLFDGLVQGFAVDSHLFNMVNKMEELQSDIFWGEFGGLFTGPLYAKKQSVWIEKQV